MNSILTLLGLGAIALYFNNRIKQTESELNDANKKAQDFEDQIEDLNRDLAAATKYEDGIKKYLKADVHLQIAESSSKNPNSFNGLFDINFTNSSSDNLYMIKKACATIELNGYAVEVFAPGQEKSTKVFAHKTVMYNAEWQGERWYEDETTREIIRKAIRSNSVTMTATVYAKVNAGGQDHIVIWNANEVSCNVEVKPKGTSWNEVGNNALNWEKYDELFEYDE